MYTHTDVNDHIIALPVGKVVCVGRNYAAHAAELNNPVPKAPLLFIKPATSVTDLRAPLVLPAAGGPCHHELELSLLIGERLSKASAEDVDGAIWGYGLGLDLTLRELQSALKAKGHPWERAKGFDGACPLSPFIAGVTDWGGVRITLEINGETRQRGNTADMLFPIGALVAEMSHVFTLEPGDVILTGTPSGVGPLEPGDTLRCVLEAGSGEAPVAFEARVEE